MSVRFPQNRVAAFGTAEGPQRADSVEKLASRGWAKIPEPLQAAEIARREGTVGIDDIRCVTLCVGLATGRAKIVERMLTLLENYPRPILSFSTE